MFTTDRKEMAQALNFGKYPVLTFDMDADQGSKANVTKMSNRYGEMTYGCVLHMGYQKKGDGIFYLGTRATMISASFSVKDAIECAEYANAPMIKPHQKVAILMYSHKNNYKSVMIVKAGRIDPSYSSATVFEHLPADEW